MNDLYGPPYDLNDALELLSSVPTSGLTIPVASAGQGLKQLGRRLHRAARQQDLIATVLWLDATTVLLRVRRSSFTGAEVRQAMNQHPGF